MITEDYINEEIMKLLLEKGCPLNKVLVQDFRPVWYTKDYNDPTWQDCDAYYIPTQSQVMKWLREQEIIITIDYNNDVELEDEEDKRYGFCVYAKPHDIVDYNTYLTYEEACEAAIKYCLEKLI